MLRLPEAFRWIRKLFYIWIRSKCLPGDLRGASGIDPDKPVCYVLYARSFTDLMVLDHHCEESGLPLPGSLQQEWLTRVVSLRGAGFLQKGRAMKMPAGLKNLVIQATEASGEVQVVPVSVFWGRNPGKEEKSIFKLLFFDDEHGGWLQRFVTFFVQGRRVYCNFGKPVSLGELIAEGAGSENTTKKLRRVLLVHFRRQKELVQGPHVYDRRQVISGILKSKEVREAIAHEAKKRRIPPAKAEAKARRYAEEVCARLSHPAIRFFDVLLSWLWKKIYDGIDVNNVERLRTLAEEYELVYMPAHRSHMDYLLIGYVLYHAGFLPPHTIAGINLNFWPVGPLLRRGGGVFIRRSFSGNRLYGKVVSAFVQFLTSSGFPFCFYPEGGRSRTGLLLPPRMGILSMVVQAGRGRHQRPILLVPVWVGYDHVLEGRSYHRELSGKNKKNESFGNLVKASKFIGKRYGKAYINFGTPLDLSAYMEQHIPDWNSGDEHGPGKTSLTPVTGNLAREMAVRTNQAAVVSPVALFSLILLSAPKKAMNESDLLTVARKFLQILKKVPFHQDTEFPEPGSIHEFLPEVEKLCGIRRFSHPGGDVIYINESDSVTLSYYRNSILHLFMMPSLVSVFFRHHECLSPSQLLDHCVAIYPFASHELFLGWNSGEVREVFGAIVDALCQEDPGLLSKSEEGLSRPDMMSQEFTCFKLLSEISAQAIEKYAVFGGLLARYPEEGRIAEKEFLADCSLMTRRLGILNGLSESVAFDKKAAQNFLSLLSSLGYLQRSDAELILEASIHPCTRMFLEVLRGDIRASILKVPVQKQDLNNQDQKGEADEALAAR